MVASTATDVFVVESSPLKMYDSKLRLCLIEYWFLGSHPVKPDHGPPSDGAGRFRTTRWSVVLLSAQSQAPGSQEALAELCGLYWYPLYGFIRRQGRNPEEARDLTQGFFLHLLERKTLTRVDPQKGKFRSFLLASLQKYLSTEAARRHRFKRGGKIEFIPFDVQSAEDFHPIESLDTLTPEKMFDARWAMALLGQAMSRLKENYAARGKASGASSRVGRHE
jgi:DNA-directed RNA polymerase specialized sigma24 family protein